MKLSAQRSVMPRRMLAGLLVVFGAVLIFLAPETWAGLVLLVLGVALELTGLVINHQLSRRNSP